MTQLDTPQPTKISLGEVRYVPVTEAAPAAEQTPEPKINAAQKLKSLNVIPWKKIESGLAALRSFILTVLLMGSLAALIGFTVVEVRREMVVIDPIRLPASLKNMGYSEEVAALRLWDAVARINEATPTVKDRVSLLPASQRVDFEAPGAGMSMQTIVRMLRRFLDLGETRIAGEFICQSADCDPQSLALRLRVFRDDGMRIIYMPAVGAVPGSGEENKRIDRYFEAAALELLRHLDPYMVAFYLYQSDKEAAEHEALQLIDPANPQLKWGLNLLGLIADSRGDHDEAVGWYHRATLADDNDQFAVAYFNWGESLRTNGNTEAAIAKFQHAAEIDPGFALTYIGWGQALSENGDLDGAATKFAHAVKLAPGEVDAINKWGTVLYEQGDVESAIAKFRHATELAPRDAAAFRNWGIMLDEKGDLDGAIAKFTRAAELAPDNAGAFNDWGTALRRVGDLDGAIAKFTRAIEIDPENSHALNNWGSALAAMGHLEAAIGKFSRAADVDARDANAHYNKAIALAMSNRADAAADAFQRFLDLRPDAENAELVRAQIAELRAQAAAN